MLRDAAERVGHVGLGAQLRCRRRDRVLGRQSVEAAKVLLELDEIDEHRVIFF